MICSVYLENSWLNTSSRCHQSWNTHTRSCLEGPSGLGSCQAKVADGAVGSALDSKLPCHSYHGSNFLQVAALFLRTYLPLPSGSGVWVNMACDRVHLPTLTTNIWAHFLQQSLLSVLWVFHVLFCDLPCHTCVHHDTGWVRTAVPAPLSTFSSKTGVSTSWEGLPQPVSPTMVDPVLSGLPGGPASV